MYNSVLSQIKWKILIRCKWILIKEIKILDISLNMREYHYYDIVYRIVGHDEQARFSKFTS